MTAPRTSVWCGEWVEFTLSGRPPGLVAETMTSVRARTVLQVSFSLVSQPPPGTPKHSPPLVHTPADWTVGLVDRSNIQNDDPGTVIAALARWPQVFIWRGVSGPRTITNSSTGWIVPKYNGGDLVLAASCVLPAAPADVQARLGYWWEGYP